MVRPSTFRYLLEGKTVGLPPGLRLMFGLAVGLWQLDNVDMIFDNALLLSRTLIGDILTRIYEVMLHNGMLQEPLARSIRFTFYPMRNPRSI